MATNRTRPVKRHDLLAAAGVLDFMSFTFPSNDPEERVSRSNYLSKRLLDVFKGRLSEGEALLWAKYRGDANTPIDAQQENLLFDKFDEVLMGEATALGWRVFESTSVLGRIAKWCDEERDGLEKIKRFNAAITLYAEVRRGISSLPFVEPEWYPTRKQAMSEIKMLRNELNQWFIGTKKRKMPGSNQLYTEIRNRISAQPLKYRYLMSNLDSLLGYLEKQDVLSETVATLTARFVTRQVTPATIINGWFDYQGGTAEGKSRQIISRLRPRK
jgi:hypothetical protein